MKLLHALTLMAVLIVAYADEPPGNKPVAIVGESFKGTGAILKNVGEGQEPDKTLTALEKIFTGVGKTLNDISKIQPEKETGAGKNVEDSGNIQPQKENTNNQNSLPSTIQHDGYVGCFPDKIARILNGSKRVPLNPNTIERCIAVCRQGHFKYAGAQFGSQCFCGNRMNPLSDRLGDEQCNMVCTGNRAQKCGGFWKNSIYETKA